MTPSVDDNNASVERKGKPSLTLASRPGARAALRKAGPTRRSRVVAADCQPTAWSTLALMSAKPYTIKIFVAQGDPEGVRIIDQMNWTGLCIVFPRERWPDVRNRKEFSRAGVYILVGPDESVEDKPRVYIGEGDGIRDRIESHYANKPFWGSAIVFLSTAGGLNKAHVQWLECALIKRAKSAGRCVLDNGNTPLPPGLTEQEEADVDAFLTEMLKILPLVEVRVFEPPRAIIVQGKGAVPQPVVIASGNATAVEDVEDTIIVPAREDGFSSVFLGENCWYAVRIGGGMRDQLKYVAAYQSLPISAITHVAPIKQIEPYGDGSKYKIVFSEPAKPIKSIPFGKATPGSMQGPRYTTYSKLLNAKSVADLMED